MERRSSLLGTPTGVLSASLPGAVLVGPGQEDAGLPCAFCRTRPPGLCPAAGRLRPGAVTLILATSPFTVRGDLRAQGRLCPWKARAGLRRSRRRQGLLVTLSSALHCEAPASAPEMPCRCPPREREHGSGTPRGDRGAPRGSQAPKRCRAGLFRSAVSRSLEVCLRRVVYPSERLRNTRRARRRAACPAPRTPARSPRPRKRHAHG